MMNRGKHENYPELRAPAGCRAPPLPPGRHTHSTPCQRLSENNADIVMHSGCSHIACCTSYAPAWAARVLSPGRGRCRHDVPDQIHWRCCIARRKNETGCADTFLQHGWHMCGRHWSCPELCPWMRPLSAALTVRAGVLTTPPRNDTPDPLSTLMAAIAVSRVKQILQDLLNGTFPAPAFPGCQQVRSPRSTQGPRQLKPHLVHPPSIIKPAVYTSGKLAAPDPYLFKRLGAVATGIPTAYCQRRDSERSVC